MTWAGVETRGCGLFEVRGERVVGLVRHKKPLPIHGP